MIERPLRGGAGWLNCAIPLAVKTIANPNHLQRSSLAAMPLNATTLQFRSRRFAPAGFLLAACVFCRSIIAGVAKFRGAQWKSFWR